jgi:Erv1 / Alr family
MSINNNGISPLIWGSSMWNMLHMIASAYPENPTEMDKQNFYNFFVSLGHVLPCHFCKKHFKQTLSSLNFNINVFDSQETIFKFVFDLHNCVNARLKKPLADDYFYIRHKYELYKQL